MTTAPRIFDVALREQRARRAARATPATFLLERACTDMVERLGAVKRNFLHVADIGTVSPILAHALERAYPAATLLRDDGGGASETLSLRPESLDLAATALWLQDVNDLPGTLVQIRRALKPDGLLLGSMIGGRTLSELRAVLTEAETVIAGGASPRVAPFADVRDVGGLLQRAGFALPVADAETLTVRYDSLFALMADLRAMGATNVLAARTRRVTPRRFFEEAAMLYAERYGDPDGRVRATFEIISLAGWAPHASQARPARRGSATASLAAALGSETPALDDGA